MTIETHRECLNCHCIVETIWTSKPGKRTYFSADHMDFSMQEFNTTEMEMICPKCGYVMQFVEGLEE